MAASDSDPLDSAGAAALAAGIEGDGGGGAAASAEPKSRNQQKKTRKKQVGAPAGAAALGGVLTERLNARQMQSTLTFVDQAGGTSCMFLGGSSLLTAVLASGWLTGL